MANTIVQSATDILASVANQNWGLNSQTITFNTDGTINTITDTITGVVYTFAYNANKSINTITDGDNTWTFGYTNGTITSITRT